MIHMDWVKQKDEIRKKHFGNNLFSQIHITYEKDILSWTLCFVDFGMYHSISGTNLVVSDHDGLYSVDIHENMCEDEAQQYVFGRPYKRFYDELYSELGLTPATRPVVGVDNGRGPG